jgi:hypothetical protein
MGPSWNDTTLTGRENWNSSSVGETDRQSRKTGAAALAPSTSWMAASAEQAQAARARAAGSRAHNKQERIFTITSSLGGSRKAAARLNNSLCFTPITALGWKLLQFLPSFFRKIIEFPLSRQTFVSVRAIEPRVHCG